MNNHFMKKIWKIILNYISLHSSSKLNMKGSFKNDIIVLHWPVSSFRKNLNEVFGQSSIWLAQTPVYAPSYKMSLHLAQSDGSIMAA